MTRIKDITGRKYGRLTAIEPTTKRQQGGVVWKCECDCGNKEVYASRANLEQGHVQSCGCLKAEKVVKRNKIRQTKDITSQKFGRLTAIEPTMERRHGSVIWKCKCKCGNDVYVSVSNLISGNTLSCGCLNRELAKENAARNMFEFKEKNCVAGTRLNAINNNKLNKNNTTGYKGVYLRKKDGKYTAQIEFQGKRYFLGSKDTAEEAAGLRKDAEKELHGKFLEWYNNRKK
ncbi:MAG: AP2 domain-containing protein [Maledivibacter sp.]|nr:AP2 domain-containing protein [Maledivibacter sp.]